MSSHVRGSHGEAEMQVTGGGGTPTGQFEGTERAPERRDSFTTKSNQVWDPLEAAQGSTELQEETGSMIHL